MRLWRALLYFYAIGPALMAVAALTLSTPFALALAAFAASAWWAARRLDARATVACGLAAFLPALVMTRLTVPGVDAPLLLRVSVVGAGVWCALCIVVARALKAAPRNRDPQPEDPEGIAKRLASLREYSRRIDRDLGRGALRCPCCRCLTLTARGAFQICPVCFWEDDGQDDRDSLTVRGGPNGDLSLAQARENYRAFGACEPRMLEHVRPPEPEELALEDAP